MHSFKMVQTILGTVSPMETWIVYFPVLSLLLSSSTPVRTAGQRRALLDPPGPPPGMGPGPVFPPHDGMGPPPPRGGPPGGFGGPPLPDDYRRGPPGPPGDPSHHSMGPPSGGHFGSGPPPIRGGYGGSSGEFKEKTLGQWAFY